ncbi:hypothetical protein scyTo_0012736 [Scyliorhinus torazame]|uniref:Caveolin n=1 Tax=Scyliorhinus torazame TaxID=75743 RepID=A0A401NHR2_SCYTO|nr:hypothetical protein [Scyliorhinus torazame]
MQIDQRLVRLLPCRFLPLTRKDDHPAKCWSQPEAAVATWGLAELTAPCGCGRGCQADRPIEPVLYRRGGDRTQAAGRVYKKGKEVESEAAFERGGREGRKEVPFEDVIAEPAGTQSLDSTWICSHVSFEFFKFVLYKVLTLVLAIPLAFVIGILFAIITYIHIWFLMPIVKTFMMMQPTFSIIWKTLMDVFISPLYQSVGLRFSAANIRFARV